MRAISKLLSLSLAVQLLAPPCFVRAEDPAKADPFRPVQPSWDGTQTAEGADPAASPTTAEPAAASGENEQFLFDSANEEPAPKAEAKQPAAEEPTTARPPEPPVAESGGAPPAAVDLHGPHVWMATGAIVLGVSFLAALTLATQFDEPSLAGATIGIGGVLGLTGLGVGVIMQNQRLDAAGQRVRPALPSGLSLSLSFMR